MTSLNDELKTFLRSSATNVERVSDKLRSHISIATELDTALSKAVATGRSIVIAGTAGSGKTHLLRTVAIPEKAYTVVSDLSALPEEKWGRLLNGKKPAVIAGNEGAFLLARKRSLPGFADVVRILHDAQEGNNSTHCLKSPIVIDAAGFDPAGHDAIVKMLTLPAIKNYVASEKNELQRNAWELLQDRTIQRRVAMSVAAASAESDADGFTFRQLWQFVADLIEGTSETETWVDRFFDGYTEVSRRINLACDPDRFAYPGVDGRLWYKDLLHVREKFLPSAPPLLEDALQIPPAQIDPSALTRKLRKIALIGLRQSPIDHYFVNSDDLWSKIRAGDHVTFLTQINKYFCYGLLDMTADLELWLQHQTERRGNKANVQASLGAAPSSDFEIVTSSVLGNSPRDIDPVRGGRLLLRHKPSASTLHVSKDFVEAMLRTRSHRTIDRRDVEYDWRLSRFFESVARSTTRTDRLHIATFDFQRRRGRWLKWNISQTVSRVD